MMDSRLRAIERAILRGARGVCACDVDSRVADGVWQPPWGFTIVDPEGWTRAPGAPSRPRRHTSKVRDHS